MMVASHSWGVPEGSALNRRGVEGESGTPRLFSADPSGTPHEWKATIIGGGREEIQGVLEDGWSDELTLEEGLELVLRSLREHDEEIEADSLSVSSVTIDDGYETYEAEEIADLLAALEDESDESEE